MGFHRHYYGRLREFYGCRWESHQILTNLSTYNLSITIHVKTQISICAYMSFVLVSFTDRKL